MRLITFHFCRRIGLTFLGAALLTVGMYRHASAGDHPALKVYLAEWQANSVGVLDSRTNKVIKHIAIPRGAHGVVIIPDGSRAFVSSDESAVISVIDTRDDEVITTIPTGKQPHGLLSSADGRFVYAAIFGDDQVLEIDSHSLKVVRTFEAPSPHNLALSSKGDFLYVAAQKPGQTGIGKIDLQTGTMKEMLKTETVPRSLGISPDGTVLCATLFDRNEVGFYSTSPLKKINAVVVGGSPHHVTFSPDGRKVLVVNQVSNDLYVIDPGTFAVTAKIAVGQKPHWMAITANGKYVYVTDESSNQVSIVDLDDKDVEQTVAVGGAPRKIAIQWKAPGGETEDVQSLPAGSRVTVNIQGPPPRFVPGTITIAPGTTVEWVNNGKNVHTVTDDNGGWDSGSLRPGEKYSRTFTEKGTFPYHCVPHAEMGMVGTIIVQ